jgi:hypothetical protein
MQLALKKHMKDWDECENDKFSIIFGALMLSTVLEQSTVLESVSGQVWCDCGLRSTTDSLWEADRQEGHMW